MSWSELTGKPTLFSGSYNDLTNKPNAPKLYSHYMVVEGHIGDQSYFTRFGLFWHSPYSHSPTDTLSTTALSILRAMGDDVIYPIGWSSASQASGWKDDIEFLGPIKKIDEWDDEGGYIYNTYYAPVLTYLGTGTTIYSITNLVLYRECKIL